MTNAPLLHSSHTHTHTHTHTQTHTHTHTHTLTPVKNGSHVNKWSSSSRSSSTTLQHTATHCNTLQHTATHCNTLQHTVTHCNTHTYSAVIHCDTYTHSASSRSSSSVIFSGYGVATISRLLKIIGLFCKRALSYKTDDILQKRPIFRVHLLVARPHCNTLQHTATHCNTL